MTTSEVREVRNCHDCGAKPGELHDLGCDVERCPFCGGQLISCECWYEKLGMDVGNLPEDIDENGPTPEMEAKFEAMLNEIGRLPWTGVWPGDKECREYGWFSKFTSKGWERCDADDPEASPDLNRLAVEAEWDPEKRRDVCRRCEGRRWLTPLSIEERGVPCPHCNKDGAMSDE